ncbi:lytic transglycosylase domain-containing protein [Streptomyces xanthii]|uniref:Lytic murein transglycosylase n=1 Tax=Streptomyces xanthii TaxID=2768069 RepID=A0A7H1BJM6_9ACTN|nr:lytic murein transglycosylase [Streptomyces xanthii]QNS08931.1 lytic murein transglycosylase [Streptomyces xanthii]
MRIRRRPRRATRLSRGLRGTAVAVAATALLTASQAPELLRDAGSGADKAGRSDPFAVLDEPLPPVASQGDDSYHTELPPLRTPDAPGTTFPREQVRAEAGIPATVLAAYRRAEASVGRTDPGCRLPWQLLAGIGKVESGQARGGDVTADGTTRHRITGPPLNGKGFALIRDTEGGAWDGDAVYDRAVGPMQFLPGTWRRWGADGNGDGRADPNNIFDAALGAGRYLCAGNRDLGTARGLERGILSYNYSRDYVRLVLYWMEFYRSGVHKVPDGKGVVPVSPGAGSKTPATKPVGDGGDSGSDGGKGGGGIVIGPEPTRTPGTPKPSDRPTDGPSPSPGPSDSAPPPTTEPPTTPPVTGDPTDGPTGTPTDPGTPTDCPSDSASPTDSPSPSPTDTPTEGPTESPSPCTAAGA